MKLHFFIVLFTICSLLFHLPSDFEANAAADWYNDSWDFRKKITASLDTVITSDLTDFPYLVSVTDSDLTQAAFNVWNRLLLLLSKRFCEHAIGLGNKIDDPPECDSHK